MWRRKKEPEPEPLKRKAELMTIGQSVQARMEAEIERGDAFQRADIMYCLYEYGNEVSKEHTAHILVLFALVRCILRAQFKLDRIVGKLERALDKRNAQIKIKRTKKRGD